MYRTLAIAVSVSGLVACSAASTNPGQQANPHSPGASAGSAAPPAAGAGIDLAGSQAPVPNVPLAGQPGSGMEPVPNTPPQNGAGAGGGAAPVNPNPMDPPTPMDDQPKLAMDECDLDTQWMGDEYCIDPPPADQGFQLRVGPTNYDSPEPEFIVGAGVEITENIPSVSGNTEDIYYYWRQFRMRPGSHHMILSRSTGAIGGGGRIGGAQTPAKDSPTGGVIPEENQGVGMPLAARTPLSFSLHYFNFTDAPLIKDVWVNVWYRDPSEVTEQASEMFSMLNMRSADVRPGDHAVLSGNCNVTGTGRILTLYGHRHANNLRFSAWRVRGGNRELVFEDYDWHEPATIEYNSVIENTPPDPVNQIAGGYTGILDVSTGDSLYFECEVVNMTNRTFLGANEAMDDEMCILIGDTVGATVSPLCSQDVQKF